jgi:urease accessory protein
MRRIRLPETAAVTVAVILMLLTAPAAAQDWAQGIPGGSFGAGFLALPGRLLPLLGLLAVGLLAGCQGGRVISQTPGAAVIALLAGGVSQQLFGLNIPYLQPYLPLILQGGLVVLGGLVALQLAMPTLVTAVLAALFGLALGIVQADWAGVPGQPLLFWLGCGLGATLLTAAGVGLSGMIVQTLSIQALRAAGAFIALTGILLLSGLL